MTTPPTPRVEQMVSWLLAHAAELEVGSVTVQFDASGEWPVKVKLTRHELACSDPKSAA